MPSDDPVPGNGLLACHDASIVFKYPHYFVLETRGVGGSKYLPTSMSDTGGANRLEVEEDFQCSGLLQR